MEINGMLIQENSALTDTLLIRMCRSKRKRIVKKWLKNKRNYKTVPSQQVFIFDSLVGGKTIVCHPMAAARIKEAIHLRRGQMKYDIVDNLPDVIGYFNKRIFNGGIFQDRYQLSHQYKNFT